MGKNSNQPLKFYKETPLFRFTILSNIFGLFFLCFLSFFMGLRYFPNRVVDRSQSYIVCEDGKKFSFNELSIDYSKTAEEHKRNKFNLGGGVSGLVETAWEDIIRVYKVIFLFSKEDIEIRHRIPSLMYYSTFASNSKKAWEACKDRTEKTQTTMEPSLYGSIRKLKLPNPDYEVVKNYKLEKHWLEPILVAGGILLGGFLFLNILRESIFYIFFNKPFLKGILNNPFHLGA